MMIGTGRLRWRYGWGLVLVGLAGLGAADPPSRPNIVVVLADDLGFGELGCYGGKMVPTPHLDKLAKEGTRFTQAYAGAPICSPSRTAFLTGQYPGRWQITSFLHDRAGNRACEQVDYLDPRAPSLPRALKAGGYATGHFGKWHLGGGRDVHDAPPFAAYGIDAHKGTYESPEPEPDITSTRWIFAAGDKVKRWERTAYFVNQTLDFLKENQANHQPSFAQIWLDDPHTPWIPGPDAPKGDSQANLKGVLTDIDNQVGHLVDGINKLGLGPDTIVIFMSDNGPLPTMEATRTGGLRGSKLSVYEGGIRSPLIAVWPDHIPAGRVDEKTIFTAVDLFPTLLAFAHAQPPAGFQLDGLDRSEAFTSGHSLDRAEPTFWEYGRNETGAFRYAPNPQNKSPHLAVREGKWKCLVNADGSGTELYDLNVDPNETTNLVKEQPEIARKLADKTIAWRQTLK